MSKYKLAIFDLAGTTVRDNNTVGSCLQGALRQAGVVVEISHVNAVMGMPKPTAIALLLEQFDASSNVEKIHQNFLDMMTKTYETSKDVGEIDGASEVFRALQERGIRVATDTGFDRATTEILFKRLGWGGLLDDSITSDEVEHGRPHADMILELCRRAGVSPAQTIKVGDTPADLKEGAAAKVGLNIGVLYGTHTKEELIDYNPDALIQDIRELLLLDI
jgi:phosphonatase-like hydrolase